MVELSESIIGIGPSTEAKLATVGITTLDKLREVNVYVLAGQVNIPHATLRYWQQMALLQRIPGLDKQFSEGLVKSFISDTFALAKIKTQIIIEELEARAKENIIPQPAT